MKEILARYNHHNKQAHMTKPACPIHLAAAHAALDELIAAARQHQSRLEEEIHAQQGN